MHAEESLREVYIHIYFNRSYVHVLWIILQMFCWWCQILQWITSLPQIIHNNLGRCIFLKTELCFWSDSFFPVPQVFPVSFSQSHVLGICSNQSHTQQNCSDWVWNWIHCQLGSTYVPVPFRNRTTHCVSTCSQENMGQYVWKDAHPSPNEDIKNILKCEHPHFCCSMKLNAVLRCLNTEKKQRKVNRKT